MSHAGHFVWRELVTPDPAATTAFYAKLFGWTAESMDMGMPYTILKHGEEQVAGATAPAMDGVPPHWLDYISVDDVDAAAGRVQSHGGQVVAPAMDIPVGRFAVCQDPSGAAFALFKSADPGEPPAGTPPAGTFCWSQLMSADPSAVAPFYAKVFGWKPVPQDNGQIWFMDGKAARASAMPKQAGVPDHWLKYVAVEDTDAAWNKAGQLGATQLAPPMDVPGMGRFAVLADPSGATFALWTHQS